jgi:hypothetical protein
MILDPLGRVKMPDAPAAGDKCVGDQSAVALLRQGFRAHHGRARFASGCHHTIASRNRAS